MRIPRGSIVYDVTEAFKSNFLECLAKSGTCEEAIILCEPLYFLATLYHREKAIGKFYYVVGQGSIVCSSTSQCAERYYITDKDSWADGVRVSNLQYLAKALNRIKRPQTPESFCREIRNLLEGDKIR